MFKKTIIDMYKDIINYLLNVFYKHKAVNSVHYKDRILINQQNNELYYQVTIEDNAYIQYIKTSGVLTATFNIDILGFPKDDYDILDKQDVALHIATDVLALLGTSRNEYANVMSVWDWSYLFLSHFTDDNAAGVRVTLEIVLPNILDYCTFEEDFDFDKEPIVIEYKEPESDLDLGENKDNGLILKPIKLR